MAPTPVPKGLVFLLSAGLPMRGPAHHFQPYCATWALPRALRPAGLLPACRPCTVNLGSPTSTATVATDSRSTTRRSSLASTFMAAQRRTMLDHVISHTFGQDMPCWFGGHLCRGLVAALRHPGRHQQLSSERSASVTDERRAFSGFRVQLSVPFRPLLSPWGSAVVFVRRTGLKMLQTSGPGMT